MRFTFLHFSTLFDVIFLQLNICPFNLSEAIEFVKFYVQQVLKGNKWTESDEGNLSFQFDNELNESIKHLLEYQKKATLEHQRASIHPAIKKPFPLETNTEKFIGFYLEHLDLDGNEGFITLDSFQSLLDKSVKERLQNMSIIAITQQSGAGKTKLCFSFALKTGTMVIIRMIHNENTTSSPLLKFIDELYDKLKPTIFGDYNRGWDILRHYNTITSRAITLFILSQVEAVARFRDAGWFIIVFMLIQL
ncbi:MAG: hypothetical protein ACYCUI_15730 [Vulcanimicrobiaceae bacterium]